jgi:hypothetical protein
MLLDKFPSTINTTTANEQRTTNNKRYQITGYKKDGTLMDGQTIKISFFLSKIAEVLLSALIKIRRSLYFAIIAIFNLSRTLSLLVQHIFVTRIHIVS